MNKLIACVFIGCFVTLGCKPDKEEAKPAGQDASKNSAPKEDPKAAPAAAVTADQLQGSWKQVGGPSAGTTFTLKKDGTFTANVVTGWKMAKELDEIKMAGSWKLEATNIVFTDLRAGPDLAPAPKEKREVDKILSVESNAFKTLDEDGVTRGYERVK